MFLTSEYKNRPDKDFLFKISIRQNGGGYEIKSNNVRIIVVKDNLMKDIILNERNIGLPPGTPVYVGDQPASEMDISVLAYDHSFAEIKNISAVEELLSIDNDEADHSIFSFHKNDSKMWINIRGLKDIESIKKLADKFNIHPLTIEDVLNTKQPPKTEKFENYRFISFKAIKQEETYHSIQIEKELFPRLKKAMNVDKPEYIEEFLIYQISIIMMKNVLITFLEMPDDPYENIRKRILENLGRIRKMGIGYLAYALIDTVVDEYYLILAHLEDDIEDYEDRAVKTGDDTFITEIQDTKKYLFRIKRAMLPLRDNIVNMSRNNAASMNDELKPFLQDLQENLGNAIETVESYRDWLSNIIEVNLSFLSYQMNKVMRILATVSSIFIPLTFIAGVYGMNFHNMPELEQNWGYPVVLGVMAVVAVLMITFFKRRHWF